ncbi:MAG: DUF4979 domain-containing protein [Prevotella sp.]
MKRYHFLAAMLSLGLLHTSCTDDTDVVPNVSAAFCPDAIEMQVPEEFSKLIYTDGTGADVLPLIKGQEVSLSCTLSPEDATFKNVLWSSSDSTVATVEDGKVTAISEKGLGYSIINVMPVGMFSGSGVSATLKVKVDEHLHQATDITLSSASDEVYEGEQLALSYDIMPESATYRTLAWSSSDTNTATVDGKGVITAVSSGTGNTTTVVITATALDGSNVSAKKTITVKRIVNPVEVSINQKYSAESGYCCANNEQELKLEFTTNPEDCTLSQLTWTSSDESVATVEGGVVKFKGFGNVTITATCPNGNSSSINLNIPVGLLRELYHNPNHYSVYNSNQSSNGTSTSNEWHNGYITITTYTVNATTQRADIKWWDTPAVIHAGNYPIIAIKVDDVKDLYKSEGVTARNLNFDVVGKSESGADFKALGNGNNKYTGDLLCSDGSHVFIYDLSTLTFGTGGLAPTNESISFNTFQLKYADIKTINHQITYNIYWFQTFKTVDDVKKWVTDVDGLTYEVKK